MLLNAVIGATQEFKVEKSARALLEVLKTESRVVRDAKTVRSIQASLCQAMWYCWNPEKRFRPT